MESTCEVNNDQIMSAPRTDPELDQMLFSNHSTSHTLDRNLRSKIISCLWPQHSEQEVKYYSAYFQHFTTECEAWRLSDSAVAIQTYRDFLELVRHLRSRRQDARASSNISSFFPPPPPPGVQVHATAMPFTQDLMLIPLAQRYPYCNGEQVTNALDLTVRLWLMLSPGSPELTNFPGRSTLDWNEAESLDDLIDRLFPKSQPLRSSIRWPQFLNLCNLDRIGGFQIVWTDHLADHLYLNEDLGTVNIYHHARVLESHKSSTPIDHVLPNDLLTETLKPLALLLPRANGDCKIWFQKIQHHYPDGLDPKAADLALMPGGRTQEHYRYWHELLSIISKAYDESEPKQLSQWWNDRRKKVQWYTFWVAVLILVLTIVFGMIQAVTGIMQVYVAYHPVRSN